jgi:hypothetical protein
MQNDTSCETVKGKFRLKFFRLEIFWLCVSFFFIGKKLVCEGKKNSEEKKKRRGKCVVFECELRVARIFAIFRFLHFFFYLFIFLFATFGCAIAGRIWVQSSVEVCK